MHRFGLSPLAVQRLSDLRAAAERFTAKHALAVGVAEMAFGGAILAWGLKAGALDMGMHVLATALPTAGAAAGGAAGLGLSVVGSIGVAAMGTAFCVPGAVLVAGGTFLLAAAGYAIGDVIGDFLDPSLLTSLKGPALATLGVYLLVSGARRAMGSSQVVDLSARVNGLSLELSDYMGSIVARSAKELRQLAADMARLPSDPVDAAGSAGAAVVAGAAGAAIGGAAAAGAVTVAGSSTLGGVALALGLASAPLWPVIACTAAGAAVGYTVWKASKRLMSPSTPPPQ